jgi:hypothetical protein
MEPSSGGTAPLLRHYCSEVLLTTALLLLCYCFATASLLLQSYCSNTALLLLCYCSATALLLLSYCCAPLGPPVIRAKPTECATRRLAPALR